MSKLIIDLNNKHAVRIENFLVGEENDLYFGKVYQNAVENVKDILECNDKKENHDLPDYNETDNELNNIVAFLGDRGVGKTSAMKTVAAHIDKYGIQNRKHFNVLDAIDPSILEDNDSIIDVVIAKMFQVFKKELDNPRKSVDSHLKKRLLERFSEVYKNMRILNTDKKARFKASGNTENVITTLSKLSASTDMKTSFRKLVNCYLKFVGNDDRDSKYLLILIDDLDMKLKSSAEICEQIRKYLMVNNVVIFISANLEQLNKLVQKSYIDSFKLLIDKDVMHSRNTNEMASKYLEKLIPINRRIFLPTLDEIDINFGELNSSIDIEIKELSNQQRDGNLKLEECVLNLILNRTGLHFIKNRDKTIHPIVPRNLRDLNNFISMLYALKECPNNDSSIQYSNLKDFESYFINNWITRNVDSKLIPIIKEFYNTHSEYKNKFITDYFISELNAYIYKDKKRGIHLSSSYEQYYKNNIDNISDIRNKYFNISIGDVIYVLNTYEIFVGNSNMIFSIKTIYNILLERLFIKKHYHIIENIIAGDVFGFYIEDFMEKKNNVTSRAVFRIDINNFNGKEKQKKMLDNFILWGNENQESSKRRSKYKYYQRENCKVGYFNIGLWIIKKFGFENKISSTIFNLEFIDYMRTELELFNYNGDRDNYYNYFKSYYNNANRIIYKYFNNQQNEYKVYLEDTNATNAIRTVEESLPNYDSIINYVPALNRPSVNKDNDNNLERFLNETFKSSENESIDNYSFDKLSKILNEIRNRFNEYSKKLPKKDNTITNFITDKIKEYSTLKKDENKGDFIKALEDIKRNFEMNTDNNKLGFVKKQNQKIRKLINDERQLLQSKLNNGDK